MSLYLRAVENLEFFSFSKTEIVLRPCLVIIKCYKECNSCRRRREKRMRLQTQLPTQEHKTTEGMKLLIRFL